MSNFQRAGFPAVMPYLTTNGASELSDFIQRVFHAEEIECHRTADGKIAHCSLRIGDSIIELSDSNDGSKATPAALHVYVEDADAVYKAAIAEGAVSMHEPMDMDYGERSGSVRDRYGNIWYIATALATPAAG